MESTLNKLLGQFRKERKAVVAFNLQNLYQLEAAKRTAVNLKLPLLIQFSERFLRFLDKRYGVKFLLEHYRSEYTFFHLDHCTDLKFIKFCIDSGFDSVMYDGSALAIEENIQNSKFIIEYASHQKCLVEGELGKVSGVEDGFGDEGSSYADLEEIKRYVKETEIDLMALGIGNAHGYYENLNGLDMNILKNASQALDKDQKFVLHGGTGLPAQIIKEAISYGVVKINFSTHLKKKTMEILQDYSAHEILYNEISYDSMMLDKLSEFFAEHLILYTK